MKIHLVIFFIAYCTAEKQIWNEQTDMLLDYFCLGYKQSNSTYIPLMDYHNDSSSFTGLQLGDISTLKRLSDVILERNNGNTRVSGTFGLEDFKLNISNIRIDGDDIGPVMIRSTVNSAEIAYTIKYKDKLHSCRTKWEKFRLGEFSGVVMDNTTVSANTTDIFNKRVLPDLNNFFESQQFLSMMSKQFEFCDIKRFLFPF